MKYRFFSDLHIERDIENVKNPSIDDAWRPSFHPDDKSTVLILAGDIWNGTRPFSFASRCWLNELSSQFKAVVMVLGNHDYWGCNLQSLSVKWRDQIKAGCLDNVHLLELADGVEHGSVVIDGVRLMGGTLWTDMHRGDPLVITKFDMEIGFDGRPLFNDRNHITAGRSYSKFRAKHWLERHDRTKRNLIQALSIGDEPVLLLTHHAPCMLSAQDRGTDTLSGYLYASDMSDLILDHPRIKQAIHGHTHDYKDYMMGDVRIRCNPRGYAPESLVSDFDANGFGEILYSSCI